MMENHILNRTKTTFSLLEKQPLIRTLWTVRPQHVSGTPCPYFNTYSNVNDIASIVFLSSKDQRMFSQDALQISTTAVDVDRCVFRSLSAGECAVWECWLPVSLWLTDTVAQHLPDSLLSQRKCHILWMMDLKMDDSVPV